MKQYNSPKFKQYGKKLIKKSLNNLKFLENKQVFDKKDFPLQDFMTSIECNRIKISNQDLNYLRSNLTFTVKQFLINQIIWDPNLKYLEQKINETKIFIKITMIY